MELASSLAAQIDDLIGNEMQRQRIPGLTLAVVQDGKSILVRGYGVAQLELDVPATAETVYQIGSLTKQFTAAACLLFDKEGKLSIEDPVGRYLDPLPGPWRGITLRHLLTHTSGIKEVTALPGFSYRVDWTPHDLLEMLTAQPLDFPPGRGWAYSNSGYVMLGWIIEKIGGKALEEILADRIFRPLGMEATRFIHSKDVVPGRADGYESGRNGWLRGEPLRPEAIAGAGGILSTVLDLAEWDAALYTDFPLDRSLREAMWTPARLGDGSVAHTGERCGEYYGFGWYLGERRGRRTVTHTGETDAGFSSMISRFEEERRTILMLSNIKSIDQIRINRSIADLLDVSLSSVPV